MNDRLYLDEVLIQRPVSEVFARAHQRIANVMHWSQGARARDAHGNNVKPHSSYAVMWSLNGAIAVESNCIGLTPPSLLLYLDALLKQKGMLKCLYSGDYDIWESCDDFNDQQPHIQVLRLLLEAARLTVGVQHGEGGRHRMGLVLGV